MQEKRVQYISEGGGEMDETKSPLKKGEGGKGRGETLAKKSKDVGFEA